MAPIHVVLYEKSRIPIPLSRLFSASPNSLAFDAMPAQSKHGEAVEVGVELRVSVFYRVRAMRPMGGQNEGKTFSLIRISNKVRTTRNRNMTGAIPTRRSRI